MEKRIADVVVKTTKEGQIAIEQDDPVADCPASIVITTDQVPALVRWLQDAATELGEKSRLA